MTGNLPPGEHKATWPEIVERFGTTPWRMRLVEGLAHALQALRAAGCRRAYVDGSFISTKERPADLTVVGTWMASISTFSMRSC